MEKTVKITKIEEKVSERSGNTYWKVSTLPVLIPKKAWFINNKEQLQCLEQDKNYHVVYDTNEKGYIQVDSFEETQDINQDIKDEEGTKSKGMTKEQEIGFYALMKGVSPMISGNLQLFVDYAGGDFEAGWLKARELVLDFVVDLQKEIRK